MNKREVSLDFKFKLDRDGGFAPDRYWFDYISTAFHGSMPLRQCKFDSDSPNVSQSCRLPLQKSLKFFSGVPKPQTLGLERYFHLRVDIFEVY